jgi:hypothetical protein
VVSIEDVARVLDRADFPMDKNQCFIYASRHYATQDILDALNRIPNTTYNSVDDVWRAVERTQPAAPGIR